MCTLNKKGFFSKEQYENIYRSGSQPARLYGNHKTHKLKSESDNLTFCPIVSSIGAYNYKLTKFLTRMLDPVIPKDHCTKDYFSFCKEIKKVNSTNKVLISYDICSLFTSIPFNETIGLAVKLIFDNNPNIKITKKDLKKLFEFVTSGTHIFFDGNYFDQINGVATGSPLGPVLANLFMGFYKNNSFCNVLIYQRYVADIICLFNFEVDAMRFFDYLNSRHPNIKFTFEKQNGGKLVQVSFVKKHQLVSTLTLPVLSLFRIRLGKLKLCFTVLSKLVVLGTFLIRKNKKLKIC